MHARNRTGRAFVCLFLGLAAASAQAQMATRRWGRPPTGEPVKTQTQRAKPPTGYVAETPAAPAIDGTLDDACWAKAHPLAIASTLDGASAASVPTEVRLLHDTSHLYLAFKCEEPFLDRLKGAPRGHDGDFWNDDSVEVFLGAADTGTYFHFGFTAFGSTYDGQVKDGSWTSGAKAAAGKGKGFWAVEAAIPLERLAGKGKPPERWIANFTRNRHTRGRWEELAWSPTFSGDSHVPARFGALLFGDPPVGGASAPREQPAARTPAEVEVLAAEGGEGVVRFDLSALKGARIHRADLLLFRSAAITGADEQALVDIEVYPLLAEFASGAKPQVAERRLELRAPWFDRFDATEAVRAWASGRPNGGFFVKVCPLWNAAATCLDVACEGRPDKVPLQTKGVRAFHRSGQTFITWNEVEDRVGKDEVRWAELKAILDGLDREREVRYCVYRSEDGPITAQSLPQAELLAVVKPLSCWNVNGRNIERPIDHVIATSDVLLCGQWNPFRDATPDGDYGRDCPIDRLVIRDGDPPLPRGTGLYVHTPVANAPVGSRSRAYYAVLTCVDGIQNTLDVEAVGPIEESLVPPEPVLQRELPKMPLFNYTEKRLHYVQWAARPMATHLPNQYYNWSVGVPEKMGEGMPLELSLHRDGHSYWRTQYRIESDSLVLSPHDFPIKSWWYGYHESLGTLRSFRQGNVAPFTEFRLFAFIQWACRKWPVDRNRILVTGSRGGASGSGALHLGLRYPEVFSLVLAGHGMPAYAGWKQAAEELERVWGKADWALKTPEGRNVWEENDLLKRLAELPASAELPLVTLTSSSGTAQPRDLYKRMLERGWPVIAEFQWGGGRLIPVSVTGTYQNNVRLDVRRNLPMLAFRTREALEMIEGAKMGDFNRELLWRTDDLVDEADRFEATLLNVGRRDRGAKADITLRRLQKFRVEAGKPYDWEAHAPDGGAVLQKGQATPAEGVLTLKDVSLATPTVRLVVRRANP